MGSKTPPVDPTHDRKSAGSEAHDDQGLGERRAETVRSDDALLERMQWVRASNRRVVERSQRLVTESIILLARIGFR
ncbi:hypothetical protein CupriaWKF_16695 [Cupriavidus sp. WKF15]|uniref:hypothetical protein n=1 Tax=Cupriavidus sp. WKF15 TaxID=3032282 RepID=UPI0023E313C9|nr:hypothetical protein [Cupriavidus sp. WKF15]WER45888.1 hypothetical protein CupriaWKF_16695 [Cupriavidus sp. WKF15]